MTKGRPALLNSQFRRLEVGCQQTARLTQPRRKLTQRLSSAPCFRGTRVPVQSLIDLVERGETIDDFLELYPAVTRQQVLTVLSLNKHGAEQGEHGLVNDVHHDIYV